MKTLVVLMCLVLCTTVYGRKETNTPRSSRLVKMLQALVDMEEAETLERRRLQSLNKDSKRLEPKPDGTAPPPPKGTAPPPPRGTGPPPPRGTESAPFEDKREHEEPDTKGILLDRILYNFIARGRESPLKKRQNTGTGQSKPPPPKGTGAPPPPRTAVPMSEKEEKALKRKQKAASLEGPSKRLVKMLQDLVDMEETKALERRRLRSQKESKRVRPTPKGIAPPPPRGTAPPLPRGTELAPFEDDKREQKEPDNKRVLLDQILYNFMARGRESPLQKRQPPGQGQSKPPPPKGTGAPPPPRTAAPMSEKEEKALKRRQAGQSKPPPPKGTGAPPPPRTAVPMSEKEEKALKRRQTGQSKPPPPKGTGAPPPPRTAVPMSEKEEKALKRKQEADAHKGLTLADMLDEIIQEAKRRDMKREKPKAGKSEKERSLGTNGPRDPDKHSTVRKNKSPNTKAEEREFNAKVQELNRRQVEMAIRARKFNNQQRGLNGPRGTGNPPECPCLNGGSCITRPNGRRGCLCDEGYYGRKCEFEGTRPPRPEGTRNPPPQSNESPESTGMPPFKKILKERWNNIASWLELRGLNGPSGTGNPPECPCLNGGSCIMRSNGRRGCLCDEGYYGRKCEFEGTRPPRPEGTGNPLERSHENDSSKNNGDASKNKGSEEVTGNPPPESNESPEVTGNPPQQSNESPESTGMPPFKRILKQRWRHLDIASFLNLRGLNGPRGTGNPPECPCLNGGSCIMRPNGRRGCLCDEGYYGRKCEFEGTRPPRPEGTGNPLERSHENDSSKNKGDASKNKGSEEVTGNPPPESNESPEVTGNPPQQSNESPESTGMPPFKRILKQRWRDIVKRMRGMNPSGTGQPPECPCQNGGTCVRRNGRRGCECEEGFYGRHCQYAGTRPPRPRGTGNPPQGSNESPESTGLPPQGSNESPESTGLPPFERMLKERFNLRELISEIRGMNPSGTGEPPECPCENGGLCVRRNGKRRCDCPDGFYGRRCQYAGTRPPKPQGTEPPFESKGF